MNDASRDLLTAALAYAENGVYVFPARLYVRGNGKKGIVFIRDWDTASTTDPGVIQGWYGRGGEWEGDAVCIDTGKSGLVAVDQDVTDGKRGPEEWERIGQKSELRVRTPTGGWHDVFRADPLRPVSVANRGEVAPGVDVRGEGGLVIAPPTRDPRGDALGQSWEWAWEGYGPAEAAKALAAAPMVPSVVPDAMDAARERRRPAPAEGVDAGTDPLFAGQSVDYGPRGGYKTERAALALLAREVGAFQSLTEPGSGRSHILAQRVGVLAGHGVGVFWTYEWALDALMAVCQENGFIAEHGAAYVRGQAVRGLDHGMREPWSAIAEGVGSTGHGASDARDAPQLSGMTHDDAPPGRLRRALLTRSQVRTLPDPVPLIERVLYRDSVCVLSGKFGTYKSFVAVSMAASLARGTEWFGHAVPEPVPVIYVAAEGAHGIRRRLDAWECKTGLTVPDSLYLISVPVRLNRPADVSELSEIIVETSARLLIFDTLHMSTPGVDENDSGQIGAVMDVLRGLQREHGVTSLLPHHTGHAGERARGSSSVEDDADTAFVIRLDGEDRGARNVRTLIHRKSKDSALLPDIPLALELVEGTGSGVVVPLNAFRAASGQYRPELGSLWREAAPSVTEMVLQVLADHGIERGITKAEARVVVVERFFNGDKKNLLNGTWQSAWNRALLHDEVINTGGDRFTIDPLSVPPENVGTAGEGDASGQPVGDSS